MFPGSMGFFIAWIKFFPVMMFDFKTEDFISIWYPDKLITGILISPQYLCEIRKYPDDEFRSNQY